MSRAAAKIKALRRLFFYSRAGSGSCRCGKAADFAIKRIPPRHFGGYGVRTDSRFHPGGESAAAGLRLGPCISGFAIGVEIAISIVPVGTCVLPASDPALKRRAIFTTSLRDAGECGMRRLTTDYRIDADEKSFASVAIRIIRGCLLRDADLAPGSVRFGLRRRCSIRVQSVAANFRCPLRDAGDYWDAFPGAWLPANFRFPGVTVGFGCSGRGRGIKLCESGMNSALPERGRPGPKG